MAETIALSTQNNDLLRGQGRVCLKGRWHPALRMLEYVPISTDLENRLTSRQHIALFHNKAGLSNGDPRTQSTSVYLPYSLTRVAPSGDGSLKTPLWRTIVQQLLKLKSVCESGASIPNAAQLIFDHMKVYCPEANKLSNFDVIQCPEMSVLISNAIPEMVELGVQLPLLLHGEIPVLKTEDNTTLYFTRKLCASLLANAFFCTFPVQKASQSTLDFNFFTLFNTDRRFPQTVPVKQEKIKCILNYFRTIAKETSSHHQIISFERRSGYKSTTWPSSAKSMCPVEIDNTGRIEDCKAMLQVDFANKRIGLGVYGENCVMEDIRFCISPELIVARLFTETLRDNEVLVVTGTEIFSLYTGFNQTFKYAGPSTVNFKQSVDTIGRTYTQVASMDAQYFSNANRKLQYEKMHMDRELQKCFVAFAHGRGGFISPVATGNWGCGIFNGDKEFKFLIQWLAASLQDRPKLKFHTFGDNVFQGAMQDIINSLRAKGVLIGALYNCLCNFESDYKKYGQGGVFKYVKKKLCK